jgi:hypothetical protein
MGIDINGGMFIGGLLSDINKTIAVPDDYENDSSEYLFDNKMDSWSPYYDADQEDCYYGFSIKDVRVDKIEGDWLNRAKELSVKFEEITGCKAMLIGMQDVY